MISKPQICKLRNIEVIAENERTIVDDIKEAIKQALNENQSRTKVKCYNCGKAGHIQRNCKAPRKRTRSVSPPRNNQKANNQSSQESHLKVKRARTTGQEIQQKNSNLTTCGYINGRRHILTIDTGTSQSIIRPDLVKETIEPLSRISLRTATGESATVYGKVNVKLTISNISVNHEFIVADIVDEVIIGTDFMISRGISLHMGEKVMIWRSVEIPLDVGYENKTQVKESVIDVRVTHIDSSEDWSVAQRSDPILAKIISAKEKDRKPTRNEISAENPLMKSYWALWNSLRLLNGCLYRTWESADGRTVTNLIVVPASKINEILGKFHSGSSGGHLGMRKTLEKLKQRFYWIGCQQAVADWIANCPKCISAKCPVERSRRRLQQCKSDAPSELKSPGDLEYSVKPSSTNKDNENISQERDDPSEPHENVRRRIKMTSDKMKARYDRAANSEGFNEDQLVLLYNPQRKKGLSPKLQTHWDGPYLVIKKLNDVVYRIQKYKSPRSKMKIVHLERLAAYGKGESVPIRDEQA